MRRKQVDEQHCADEIAAREYQGNSVPKQIQSQDNPLPEVPGLGVIKSLIHLGQRPEEEQYDSERQQNDRETQRRKKFDGPVGDR